MIFGDDLNHARRSLESTVVMTKSRDPVHINYVDGFEEINSTLIMSNEIVTLKLEDLDLCTVYKLGLVNQKGRVLNTARSPSRQYRAGFNNNNTRFSDLYYHREQGNVVSKSFCNTLLNNYPPVEEAIKAFDQGFVKGIALCHQYCLLDIQDDIKLFRYDQMVGDIKSNNIKLMDDFSFLREELKECLDENY